MKAEALTEKEEIQLIEQTMSTPEGRVLISAILECKDYLAAHPEAVEEVVNMLEAAKRKAVAE